MNAPPDGVADDSAAQDRDDVCEAESRVDHKGAFRRRRSRNPSRFGPVWDECWPCAEVILGYSDRWLQETYKAQDSGIQRNRTEDRTWTPQAARKIVLFKNDLVVVFLDVRQIEDGLSQEQVGLLRVDLASGRAAENQSPVIPPSAARPACSPRALCLFPRRHGPTPSSARPNCSGCRGRTGPGTSTRRNRRIPTRVRRRHSSASPSCSGRWHSGRSSRACEQHRFAGQPCVRGYREGTTTCGLREGAVGSAHAALIECPPLSSTSTRVGNDCCMPSEQPGFSVHRAVQPCR